MTIAHRREPLPFAGVDELAKVPGRYLGPYLAGAPELLAA